MRLRLAIAGLLVATGAIAQIMVPGREMTPNPNASGPSTGNLIPNQGEMTPNPAPVTNNVITCQGTGWDFTKACNSQYVYTVRGLF